MDAHGPLDDGPDRTRKDHGVAGGWAAVADADRVPEPGHHHPKYANQTMALAAATRILVIMSPPFSVRSGWRRSPLATH